MNDDYEALRALYRAARAEEPPTRADRHAVRMALAAAATVGVQVATTGAAASIPSLSGAAAVSAKGILPLLFGGKFLGGLVVGAAIGTAVSATAYVVDPPKPSARVGVSTNRPPTPRRPVVARVLPATPAVASSEATVAMLADPALDAVTALGADPVVEPTMPAVHLGVEPLSDVATRAPGAEANAARRVVAGSQPAALREKPTPRAPIVTAPRAVNASAPGSADQLLQETEALAHVQSALNRSDPAVALALLNQQAKAFSSGQLAQEREAAYVLALCAAGRTKEAEQARVQFVASHPNSPLVKRVKKSCD